MRLSRRCHRPDRRSVGVRTPIRTVPLEAGARSEQGSTWRAPTCEVRRSMNVPAGDSSLSTQVARLAVTGSPERGYEGRVSTQGWQRFRMAPRAWCRGGIGSRRTRTPGGRRDRTRRGSVCAGRRRRCTPPRPLWRRSGRWRGRAQIADSRAPDELGEALVLAGVACPQALRGWRFVLSGTRLLCPGAGWVTGRVAGRAPGCRGSGRLPLRTAQPPPPAGARTR